MDSVLDSLLYFKNELKLKNGSEPSYKEIYLFAGLTEREIEIYNMRFFENETFRAIGLNLKISASRVSQILQKTLRKIRYLHRIDRDLKESTQMTRDEKIAALFERVVGKNEPTNIDEYKDAYWQKLGIEGETDEDIVALKQRVAAFLAGAIDKAIAGPGVFDILVAVKRVSDFDASEEAHARREENRVKQEEIVKALNEGMAEIDTEDAH